METLEDVFPYVFFECRSQAVKAIAKKNTDFSSKKTSKKKWSWEKDMDENDMEVVEVLVTDQGD